MPETFHTLIARAVRQLDQAGIERARLDVEVLLMHLLGIDRAHLYLRLPENVDNAVARALMKLVERRAAGEPVAYITGYREFMGLSLHVDRRVLIPRPETEGLVERCLAWLERHPGARRVVDVGTGSGAIAISIDRLSAVNRPLVVAACDVSRDALAVARENVARLRANRVGLVRGRLLEWCAGPLDLIVANLPYLRDDQRQPEIAQEPDLALFASDQGFALYAAMIPQAARTLAVTGALMCEIDPDQREPALAAGQTYFPEADVRVEQDLSRRDRYLIVERLAQPA